MVLWALNCLTSGLECNYQKQEITLSEKIMNEHNRIRERHGMPPLTLNKDLMDLAEQALDHYSKRGKWKRKHMKYNGEALGRNFARFIGYKEVDGKQNKKTPNSTMKIRILFNCI